jgi:hypothetical protein
MRFILPALFCILAGLKARGQASANFTRAVDSTPVIKPIPSKICNIQIKSFTMSTELPDGDMLEVYVVGNDLFNSWNFFRYLQPGSKIWFESIKGTDPHGTTVTLPSFFIQLNLPAKQGD